MRLWRGLIGGVLFGALAVEADVFRCPASGVSVCASDRAVVSVVCEGAGQALHFLAAAGLDTRAGIEVHVVDRLPEGVEPEAAGCYVDTERRIYVLAPTLLMPPGSARASGPLRYSSLVAHEVAHAVAASNFTVERPTLVAHEYIAAVTMIAAMPVADRAHLLAVFPNARFDSERQMSGTLFLLAPRWFAVAAYRHYRAPGNGPVFLRRVLAGEALAQGDEH
jgi:hypothetical protein